MKNNKLENGEVWKKGLDIVDDAHRLSDEDWEKKYGDVNYDVAFHKWFDNALNQQRSDIIEKVTKFINNHQDCGACNLDIEVKEFLTKLEKE